MDPIEGTVYVGKVVKVMDFGAFVNFYGTRDGLVHVSEISEERVENVSDIFNEGDEVKVLFLGYDSKGRARLTMRMNKFNDESSEDGSSGKAQSRVRKIRAKSLKKPTTGKVDSE